MDDDSSDWLSAATEEEPPPEPVKEEKDHKHKKKKKEEGAEEPPAEEEAPPEQPPEAEPEPEFLDPDKLLLFKHWIRPKFLQYNYLYNYRHNYYDDVIDYLDKRQKGLSRDVPRAQTWAERVLRTYTNKLKREEYFQKTADDLRLVTKSKLSGAFFHYHSKQYVNRRYSSLLY